MDKTCSACRFWNSAGSEAANEDHGSRCQRFPPTAVWGVNHRGDQVPMTHWPRTHEGDWCGEFQAGGRTAGAIPLRKRK